MSHTIKELAQEALDVQNASNLSGVALSFGRAMADLRGQPECTGSDWCRNHPITILWVNKLEDMVGSNFGLRYLHASDACATLATSTDSEALALSNRPISQ